MVCTLPLSLHFNCAVGKQWLEGKVGVRLLVRVAVRVWVELFVVRGTRARVSVVGCGGIDRVGVRFMNRIMAMKETKL